MSNPTRVFLLEDGLSRRILFFEIFMQAGVLIDWADTVSDAKETFNGKYDLILLDHDLEDEHYENQQAQSGTGTEFAKWLAETQDPDRQPVIIHSYNPDGAQRMRAILEENGWIVFVLPFGLDLLKKLEYLFISQSGAQRTRCQTKTPHSDTPQSALEESNPSSETS